MTKENLIADIEATEKQLLELQTQFAGVKQKNSLLRYNLRLLRAKRVFTEEMNFGSKTKPDLHLVKYMVYDETFKNEDHPDKPVMIERKSPLEIDGRKVNERWKFIETKTK
jgi:hypothetical protein